LRVNGTQIFGGYFSLGDRGFAPFTGGTNVFSIGDTLNLIRGKHDIKFGLSIRANQMNVRTRRLQDGYWIASGFWSGDATADLLQGIASLAIHDQTFKGTITGRRWKTFRPFVQDDWRVTSNLTVILDSHGTDHSGHGSGRSPGQFRFCYRTIPDCGREIPIAESVSNS